MFEDAPKRELRRQRRGGDFACLWGPLERCTGTGSQNTEIFEDPSPGKKTGAPMVEKKPKTREMQRARRQIKSRPTKEEAPKAFQYLPKKSRSGVLGDRSPSYDGTF
ncbi:hypothetical protein OUZ56_000619 [Daphnia magna]|uniref:Uncharacterized protein n=1 Tax=Daphnia magna TaxID=35525 RepID=A0ABR0A083_9CRUS|nr:hypothetical protein OUZ56_000619 [Daphnia magna]